jgi:CHAD domain-containing protein
LAGTTPLPTPIRPAVKARASPAQSREQLEKLLRYRLRKFMGLLPAVLTEDDAKPVHDLRVWSRRLQQVVVALCPEPMPDDARRMARALKRSRRALGVWRDCDVMLDLLERKLRRVRNPGERLAWEKIRDWTMKRRAHAMRQARRKLANRKLFTLGQCARRVADEALPHHERADGAGAEPAAILAAAVGKSYGRWREALARARETLAAQDVHGFRIETKRLRYRIELARDLGDQEAGAALSSPRQRGRSRARPPPARDNRQRARRLGARRLGHPPARIVLRHRRFFAAAIAIKSRK